MRAGGRKNDTVSLHGGEVLEAFPPIARILAAQQPGNRGGGNAYGFYAALGFSQARRCAAAAYPLKLAGILEWCIEVARGLNRSGMRHPYGNSAEQHVTYFIVKAALSGILIALISETARRYPALGGLIASLPLISLMAIIWLWRDTGGDTAQIAGHARATLWYVVPSLPFFLILPWLMEKNVNFWVALIVASVITICLYLSALWLEGRLGISFGQGQ